MMTSRNICDSYKSTLPTKCIQMAEKRFGETEEQIREGLKSVREWIHAHPKIHECRMDANFLIRFLRRTNYDVANACQMLENYLMAFQFYPSFRITQDNDFSHLLEMDMDGFSIRLLERDEFGRKVAIWRVQNLNPRLRTSVDLTPHSTTIMDLLLCDEMTQVSGVVVIIDFEHTTIRHLTIYSIPEILKLTRLFFNACPFRLECVYVINLPWIALKLAELMKKLTHTEIEGGVHFLKNIDELYKVVDRRILPKEYGGLVPMVDMINDGFNQLTEYSKTELPKFFNFFKLDFTHSNL